MEKYKKWLLRILFPHWVVIYASAAYTFYRLTMAVIRNIKIQENDNPIFTAAKVLDLSSALMSIYALQSAMITTFGADMEEWTRRLLNSMTGSVVCISVMLMAVFMIRRSRKSKDTGKNVSRRSSTSVNWSS